MKSLLVTSCSLVVALAAFHLTVDVVADETFIPLHQRVDRALEDARVVDAVSTCSDSTFLRRAYLDLVGVIPSGAEAREFLDDPSPQKRDHLIEQLLADDRFSRHMQTVFDIMLMERRPKKHIAIADWHDFLFQSFQANKPLDQLIREILLADGTEDKNRAAARFYLDRDLEKDLLTRDVGRIFLGRDMQCAQCHDHPQIGDYTQEDYYGIFAFFNRTSLFTDAKKKQSFLAETAEGDLVDFKSVFTGDAGKAGPHLPAAPAINEPDFKKGEAYIVKPAKNVRSVPKFSRRAQLAKELTSGDHRPFQRNLANRLWGHMLGRGIVHPYDLVHSDNPASQPRLLEILTDELVEMRFDIRKFFREIAMTKVYQRQCVLDDSMPIDSQQVTAKRGSFETQSDRISATIKQTANELAKLNSQISEYQEHADAVKTEFAKVQSAAQDAAARSVDSNAKVEVAQGKVDKHLFAMETIAAIVSQARQAAETLPDEPVLADVSAKLSARNEEIQQALTTARQQLAELRTAAESAERQSADLSQQMAEAEKSSAVAITELQAAIDRKQQLKSEQNEARVALANLAETLKDIEVLASYLDSVDHDQDTTNRANAWSELVDRWNNRFHVAGIEPLSPEQIAFCALQATGRLAELRNGVESAEKARLAKEKKEVTDDTLRPMIEKGTNAKVAGEISAFVGVLSQGSGPAATEYQATVQEALFLANGNKIMAWLKPRPNNLCDRLIKLAKPAEIAEEMYLSILARRPSEEEIALVTGHLTGRDKDRNAAVEEMAWGLMASAEFRFRH